MAGVPRSVTLFLCKCGPNMGEDLDFEELQRWAEGREEFGAVHVHELLCTPQGQEAYKELLADRDTDVIVAGCSPKMHEKTFRELTEEVGLNLAQVQMANIREHCAWVTADVGEATTKAKALIHAATLRTREAEPLERRTMEVITDLLVIGGGMAGIEAALTAANAGRKVTIVDREISLGGAVIKLEEVAPTMECGPCVLAPPLSDVRDHPNIDVITGAEITEILGFLGNFTVKIHQGARYVDDSCISCEACFEVCPVDVESRFHHGLGTHKAIYTLFAGSVPLAAAIDADHCLQFKDGSCDACVPACPFESIQFGDQEQDHEISVGSIVVATGFEPGEVTSVTGLAEGRPHDVYTLTEFERIVSSNGPCDREILCADGKPPSSIAIVFCAGSRRDDGVPYCSGICCTNAIKAAIVAHELLPDVELTCLYRDMVFPGPKAQRLLEEARAAGVRFERCEELLDARVERTGGGVLVRAGGQPVVTADLVLLSNGLRPAAGTAALAEMLHAELRPDGYYCADNDLLHATGTTIDGVYVAGCACGPCDLGTAVTQGRAAAGEALSKLREGVEIELEYITADIDEALCAGCKLCTIVCPYRAILYDPVAGVSRVNEAICHGCGTCASSCPSGAARAKHFSDAQLLAEIKGVIHG